MDSHSAAVRGGASSSPPRRRLTGTRDRGTGRAQYVMYAVRRPAGQQSVVNTSLVCGRRFEICSLWSMV